MEYVTSSLWLAVVISMVGIAMFSAMCIFPLLGDAIDMREGWWKPAFAFVVAVLFSSFSMGLVAFCHDTGRINFDPHPSPIQVEEK